LNPETPHPSSGLERHIFKPLKVDGLVNLANDDGYSQLALSLELGRHRSCVSVRQAAEWGMGSLQKDFGGLTRKKLTLDHGQRKLILDCCFLLHNYRVGEAMMPNQIRTTFDYEHLAPLLGRRAGMPLHVAMK